LTFVGHTAALSNLDKQAINNDWVNWVPDNGACRAASGSTSGPLVGGDNPEKAFNFLLQKGFSKEIAAAFVGNFMQESSVNPTADQPDGPGRGIAQWSEGGRWDTSKNDNLKDFAGNRNILDLGVQLDFVWYELTKTSYRSVVASLESANTLAEYTNIIATQYEQAGVIGPRLQFAEQALERYSGNDISQVSDQVADASPTGCAGGSAGNGTTASDVVHTALGLAWDDTGHGKNKEDATQAYQVAMPQYNGSTGNDVWSDCGVFVATVMRMSGVDDNFPLRMSGTQEDYMRSRPSLYQEIMGVTDTSKLQPGDILANDVHIYIYTGKQSSGYNAVGASQHDHVPQASSFSSGFSVFRVINNAGNIET
jgi:hypothetical protein